VAWAAATPAAAQSVLLRNVVPNGSTSAVSGGMRLVGTVGQPALGISYSPTGIVRSGYWQQPGGLVTADEPAPDLPIAFALHQNYPNPFNPTTTIVFAVLQAAHVRIAVYDLLGRNVRNLLRESRPPGEYRLTFDASDLPSGIYLYRMIAGEFTQTRRLVLLR
jgi:hypothetical protein